MPDPNSNLCNGDQHVWHSVEWTGPPPTWGFPVEWRCENCDKTRKYLIDRLGNIASARYIPAPGYHKYNRGSRPPKSAFRLEMVKEMGIEFGSKRRRS